MLPADLHLLIRRLHLRVRRKMQASLLGNYHTLFKGSGLTFEEVREYQPGDDIRSIDWNVTARLNAPFIKTFSEERQRTILLMIDISGSLNFSTEINTKQQILAEMAALLALSAVENRDRVGLLLFAGKVERYLPPGKARMNIPRLLSDILLTEPSDPRTNLTAALDFVNKLKLRKAVVFLMSDFLAEDYENSLRQMARRHETFALKVTDPAEIEVPRSGLIRLRDAETGQIRLIDTNQKSFPQNFQEQVQKRRREFERTLAAARIDSLEVSTVGGHLEALIRFFERRAAHPGVRS
ncbi:DUF58 domain-containing protein [Telmatocola sphagniphila]|uniref:DUF58 domain-containing protein n=1 Tax=Telmatocola sphagniphila TaxID=1123043 RepID=A0A8E6EYF1_9BACT|nr:DUF58 domain-containing protein [Telmatocola sphagniphila]QVL32306.1 DUF58 domain-containing protein [Telmatocola sphagniphila]